MTSPAHISTRGSLPTALVRALRSELVRSRRRGVLLGWAGLTVMFAVLANSVMFSVATGSGGAPEGPGVAFPALAELQSAAGLTAGLGAAASMFGLVTLAFWAVLTATDHSTGLIRLLASAQPRRGVLLAGKVLSLSIWTAAATTLALAVNVVTAPIAAGAAGASTQAWTSVGPGALAGAWLDLLLTLLVWGLIGLVLATASRSAAIAVSVGAGWVLLVEGVVGAALSDVAAWLPGSALAALARGGTSTLSYGSALTAAAAYALLGLAVGYTVVSHRDVTD
jgi:ABC-type transport system involved in multi-copper enzyme maturation permease subunit